MTQCLSRQRGPQSLKGTTGFHNRVPFKGYYRVLQRGPPLRAGASDCLLAWTIFGLWRFLGVFCVEDLPVKGTIGFHNRVSLKGTTGF